MRFATQRSIGRPRLYWRLGALLFMTAVVNNWCLGQQVVVTGRIELFRDGIAQRQDSSGAVVWLTPVGDSGEPQSLAGSPPQQLVQKNKSFLPHVIVLRVGVPVAFPNKDPFFHNVFSLFEGKRFDLGLYEACSSRTVVFHRQCISHISSTITPHLSPLILPPHP